jgi:hypothetical protein
MYVSPVTALLLIELDNVIARCLMPVLVIALLALFAFGLIGVLLVVAMFVETRKKPEPPAPSSRENALSKHKNVA